MKKLLQQKFSSLWKMGKGYYTFLLISLGLLFIFRPYDRSAVYVGVWKFLLTVVFFSALFNCKHKTWVKKVALILTGPVLVFSWMSLWFPYESLFVLNAVMTTAFMLICAGSILYDVVLRARVTLETLRGVVCAYFMVAFGFAYIYYLIEYINPGSFHIVSHDVDVTSYLHYISEMLYFSFVTLLTIGYGDITAITDIGQTASVLEGIIGQFYVAMLVARLVAVYSLYPDQKVLQVIEQEAKKK